MPGQRKNLETLTISNASEGFALFMNTNPRGERVIDPKHSQLIGFFASEVFAQRQLAWFAEKGGLDAERLAVVPALIRGSTIEVAVTRGTPLEVLRAVYDGGRIVPGSAINS